jgi:hypothetical protein
MGMLQIICSLLSCDTPILAAKSKTYIFVVAVSIRVEESRFVYFLQK